VTSSPAVANGVVYVASEDGKLYALNASTGALLWNYVTNRRVQGSPAVANGAVYIGSFDHNVYAFGQTRDQAEQGADRNPPVPRMLRPRSMSAIEMLRQGQPYDENIWVR